MKKLLLIRHGKAADPVGVSDFDRPLTNRGEKNAEELAKKLKKKELVPQHIVSSTAKRALSTAIIIAEELHLPSPEQVERIYEASRETLLNVINDLSDEYDFIALAGHNPGFSEVAGYLIGDYVNLPTCGAILIGFEAQKWQMISADTGTALYRHEP